MAAELWNRVHILYPGAISTVRIQFNDCIDGRVSRLLDACHNVLLLLRSHVLRAELRVFYALLRVCNNNLRQHKPFRALKQVERCINRVNTMKLIPTVLDLEEMCPRRSLRRVMTEMGQCEVPSQPTLEWFCLKVLGASKLLVSLVDHCSHAFVLTQKHLSCEESIVLNLVLVSMLSRLRVFFLGILKNLHPLYLGALELLEVVAQARPMSFLADFNLPADLPTFIGASRWAELEAELPKTEDVDRKGSKKPIQKKHVDRTIVEDLGSRILQSDSTGIGHMPLLDIKAILKRSTENGRKVVACHLETPKEDPALIAQKQRFMQKAATVSSFSDMAAHLAEAIHWCRSRKLHRDRCRLAFLNLKCQRMKRLEAEGFRLERKLKSFRREFSEALHLFSRPMSTRLQYSLHDRWRSYHFRTRFGYVMRRRWSYKRAQQNDRKKVLAETPRLNELTAQDADEDNVNDRKDELVESSACVWSTSSNEIDDIFATLDF
ncbi:hypothetical protein GN956_G24290 [Arapaima gigas]